MLRSSLTLLIRRSFPWLPHSPHTAGFSLKPGLHATAFPLAKVAPQCRGGRLGWRPMLPGPRLKAPQWFLLFPQVKHQPESLLPFPTLGSLIMLNAGKVSGGSTFGGRYRCEQGAVHGAGQLGLFYFERAQGDWEKARLWSRQIPRALVWTLWGVDLLPFVRRTWVSEGNGGALLLRMDSFFAEVRIFFGFGLWVVIKKKRKERESNDLSLFLF